MLGGMGEVYETARRKAFWARPQRGVVGRGPASDAPAGQIPARVARRGWRLTSAYLCNVLESASTLAHTPERQADPRGCPDRPLRRQRDAAWGSLGPSLAHVPPVSAGDAASGLIPEPCLYRLHPESFHGHVSLRRTSGPAMSPSKDRARSPSEDQVCIRFWLDRPWPASYARYDGRSTEYSNNES